MKKGTTLSQRFLLMTLIAVMAIGLLSACGSGLAGDGASGDKAGVVKTESKDQGGEDKAKKKTTSQVAKDGGSALKDAEQKTTDEKKTEEGKTKSAATESSKQTSGQSKQATTSQSGGKQATTSKTKTVTVSIECYKATDVRDKYSQYASVIPTSGVIMGQTAVTIKGGETAFDVTLAAAKKNGITISHRGTQFGLYIDGIQGLFEKYCGSQSGWQYKVNGAYPNTGCDTYSVQDGDVIVWHYVLSPEA